jgi:hypothetical protein
MYLDLIFLAYEVQNWPNYEFHWVLLSQRQWIHKKVPKNNYSVVEDEDTVIGIEV